MRKPKEPTPIPPEWMKKITYCPPSPLFDILDSELDELEKIIDLPRRKRYYIAMREDLIQKFIKDLKDFPELDCYILCRQKDDMVAITRKERDEYRSIKDAK